MDPVEESLVGETLEDISLLSTLSLDRNDICQEYMEDLDNLGEKTVGIHPFFFKIQLLYGAVCLCFI